MPKDPPKSGKGFNGGWRCIPLLVVVKGKESLRVDRTMVLELTNAKGVGARNSPE